MTATPAVAVAATLLRYPANYFTVCLVLPNAALDAVPQEESQPAATQATPAEEDTNLADAAKAEVSLTMVLEEEAKSMKAQAGVVEQADAGTNNLHIKWSTCV